MKFAWRLKIHFLWRWSGIILLPSCILHAQFPASIDLRNYNGKNYTTPVKAQKGGTCWCHGTMSAIEGNLLWTGAWERAGESGEPNMAEYHLDWWNGFNAFCNADLYPDTANDGLNVHWGGDYRVVAAYLARLSGPVREIDAPGDGPDTVGGAFYATPPLFKQTYRRYFSSDIEWYTAGGDLATIDSVKSALLHYGVCATCMCVNDSFTHGTYHYQPPSDTLEPNHSVAIVGWNDMQTVSAACPAPGAWLCKNSWGATSDYIWISYYDKQCAKHLEMGAVAFGNVDTLAYDNVYSYDYHGWRATARDVAEGFNRFTAARDEYLAAVGFYTATDSVSYAITVYGRFENGGLVDSLAAISGFCMHRGFHARRLYAGLLLTKDKEFCVRLTLDRGGHAYDRTSYITTLMGMRLRTPTLVRSTAAPDQGYYRDSGVWKDFIGYRDTSGWDSTGNLCIKAYTTATPPPAVFYQAPRKPFARLTLACSPNPCRFSAVISYRLDQAGAVSLAVFNAGGRLVASWPQQRRAAGKQRVRWEAKDGQGNPLASGIYRVVLTVRSGRSVTVEYHPVALLR